MLAERASDSVEMFTKPDYEKLVETLRDVTLVGDRTIRPYEDADIHISILPIDSLSPTSLYVLKENLDRVEDMAEYLSRWHRAHPLFIHGLGSYSMNGEQFNIAPPIIETSDEGKLIVDGLHRLYYAKSLGMEHSLVVEITNVDPRYPLVPLPVTWEDVKVCSEVPSVKRRYRFETVEDLIAMGYEVPPNLTEDNIRYYNYRDLSALGSSGIRPITQFRPLNT